jgi:septum formation protein
MQQKIILASGSKSRKTIMDSLGIPYIAIPADINEKAIRDKNLKLRAGKIARAKAEKVAGEHEGIIISADSFCVCDGHVLEKPKSLDEAREMLKLQGSKPCVIYTGFCYLDKKNHIDYSTTIAVKYVFRKMSDGEINIFVEENPVLTWAGAFALADVNQFKFFEKIDGSLTAATGLPVEVLIPCLERSGVKI